MSVLIHLSKDQIVNRTVNNAWALSTVGRGSRLDVKTNIAAHHSGKCLF